MAESGTTRSCTVEFLAAESFMVAFFAQKSCIVESCNAKSCMADILADKFHCGIVCLPYSTSAIQLPQKEQFFAWDHATKVTGVVAIWTSE